MTTSTTTSDGWAEFGRLFDALLNDGVITIDLHCLNPNADDPAFWFDIDGFQGYDTNIIEALKIADNKRRQAK